MVSSPPGRAAGGYVYREVNAQVYGSFQRAFSPREGGSDPDSPVGCSRACHVEVSWCC